VIILGSFLEAELDTFELEVVVNLVGELMLVGKGGIFSLDSVTGKSIFLPA
jgi:hypothetical protein